ncbi:hypothetical protein [Clostridium tyrobutyricum]|uniref:hypothetical protein n=1 Tax=Clostridium tyrobutyricum TaxID=1519 RepID=UPI00189C9910|nr:hypothetical protein [Clostridium tyrobutyricum]
MENRTEIINGKSYIKVKGKSYDIANSKYKLIVLSKVDFESIKLNYKIEEYNPLSSTNRAMT